MRYRHRRASCQRYVDWPMYRTVCYGVMHHVRVCQRTPSPGGRSQVSFQLMRCELQIIGNQFVVDLQLLQQIRRLHPSAESREVDSRTVAIAIFAQPPFEYDTQKNISCRKWSIVVFSGAACLNLFVWCTTSHGGPVLITDKVESQQSSCRPPLRNLRPLHWTAGSPPSTRPTTAGQFCRGT